MRALLDTHAVVALLAGIVTVWATGLWWLLAPTLLLYLWLVREAFAAAADLFAWEEPDLRGISASQRQRREADLDVQRQLNAELRAAPAHLRDAFASIWMSVKALGERQLVLVRQLQSIEEYIGRLETPGLDARWQELVSRRDRATDASLRAQYQQALQSIEGQRQNVNDLRTAAERIDAQLQTVQHTLKQVYGQVLRMKALGSRSAAADITALNADLHGLTQQVGTLSEAVDQVYLQSGGGSA